jgi:hypothetical protein
MAVDLGLVTGRGKKCFSIPQYLDCLWGLLSFLQNRYSELIPQGSGV